MRCLLPLPLLLLVTMPALADSPTLDEQHQRLEKDLTAIEAQASTPRYMGAGIRYGLTLLFGGAALLLARTQPADQRAAVIGLGSAAAATAIAGTLVLALPNPSASAAGELRQLSDEPLEARVSRGQDLLEHAAETRNKGRFIGGTMMTVIGLGFGTWALAGRSMTGSSRAALGVAGLLMAGVGTSSLLTPSFEEKRFDAYVMWRDAPQPTTSISGVGFVITGTFD